MNSAQKKERLNLVLYFQVHQPARLRTLRFFDIGSNSDYIDAGLNRDIMRRVTENCYLPANALLLKLIKKHPDIRIAFSISGTTLDQMEEYAPDVLKSFRALADTGSVEFLAETYHHSLSCMIPSNEFELQVAKHQKKIARCFGVVPTVFRNTELIYSEGLGARVHALGFKGMFIDAVDRVMGNRDPHQLHAHPGCDSLKLLTRDYRLSDEISFRFSNRTTPLTADTYIAWLMAIPGRDRIVNLAMDYETFGEHQKKETGIFFFLEQLLSKLAKSKTIGFMCPTEAVTQMPTAGALPVPGFISWADQERDLSAWLGNEMQRDAFDTLVSLEQDVKDLHDRTVLETWRSMQTSDHFYYMATKKGSDGQVHSYFSPYPSPYEAFINYMNVLTDFSQQIRTRKTPAIEPVRDDSAQLALSI